MKYTDRAYQISDKAGDRIVVHKCDTYGICIRGDFSHAGYANWPLYERPLPYAFEGKMSDVQLKALQDLQKLGWRIPKEKWSLVDELLLNFKETTLPVW